MARDNGAAPAAAAPAAAAAEVTTAAPADEMTDEQIAALAGRAGETVALAADGTDDSVSLSADSAGDAAILAGSGDQAVTITQAELVQLRQQAALGARAHARLLNQTAADSAQQIIAAGSFPPAKKPVLARLFFKEPADMKELCEGLPCLSPLARLGFAGNGTREVAGEVGGQGFEQMVDGLLNRYPDMDPREACSQIAAENPEVYQAYRRGITPAGTGR